MTFLVMLFMYQHPTQTADLDGDGKISEQEFIEHAPQAFNRMDKNQDGYLTREDRQRRHFRLLGKLDLNQDHALDENEIATFLENLSLSEDGAVDLNDLFQTFHPHDQAANEEQVAHMTHFIDRDENGIVEMSDLTALFEQLPKNEEGNVVIGRMRHGHFRGPFPHLADENKDQILTRDEWSTFIANLPVDENGFIDTPKHRTRGSRQHRQNPFDGDQDGQISLAELETWFTATDQDGNGEISLDELPQRRHKRARKQR